MMFPSNFSVNPTRNYLNFSGLPSVATLNSPISNRKKSSFDWSNLDSFASSVGALAKSKDLSEALPATISSIAHLVKMFI